MSGFTLPNIYLESNEIRDSLSLLTPGEGYTPSDFQGVSDIQVIRKNLPLSRSYVMGSSGLCHLESVNAIVDDKGHGSLKNMEPKTNGRYSYKSES